jgi:hypothetical protein
VVVAVLVPALDDVDGEGWIRSWSRSGKIPGRRAPWLIASPAAEHFFDSKSLQTAMKQLQFFG